MFICWYAAVILDYIETDINGLLYQYHHNWWYIKKVKPAFLANILNFKLRPPFKILKTIVKNTICTSAKIKVSWFLFINNKTSLSNVNVDLVNEKTKKEEENKIKNKQTNKQTNKNKNVQLFIRILLYYVHSI